MKSRITVTFFLLFLGLGIHGEEENAFKKDLGTCQKFLKSYCGSTPWEECVQKPDKKSHQVAQCIRFLVSNKNKLQEEDELVPTFKTLVTDLKKDFKDNSECIKIANTVCGDGTGFNECLEKNAGSFPSYCRGAVKEGLNKMQAAYNNDVELKSCTDVAIGSCEKLLKEENNLDLTDAQESAMYAKYQACLEDSIPKLQACQGLINADKGSKKAPGVQRIDYR